MTDAQAGYRPVYAMAVPGPRVARVVLTREFYARYGYVLGRQPAPAARPRVAPGTVAGWVREARERHLQALSALSKGGHLSRNMDWKPPMTGAQLAERRRALNLSQRDLAKGADVSRGVLSSIEAGQRQASPGTWRALLAALAALAAAEAEPQARR